MTLVYSRPYNVAIGLCMILVLSVSQTGVPVIRPLMALGAVLVYWQSARVGTLVSKYSILVNLQFVLSVLWIRRFPAHAEIVDAVSQRNLMGLMGVLASISYGFILSQYVINITSPRFLYGIRSRAGGRELVFVGSARLAGLKVLILALAPFFYFGSMVDGVFVSQFASPRTVEMQYWGHLLFGDSLLFLCQLLAVFFFHDFLSLVMTTVAALCLSFLMGSRSGTIALLLFLCVLLVLRLCPEQRGTPAGSAHRGRSRAGRWASSRMLVVALVVSLLAGASFMPMTAAWTGSRIVRSILGGSMLDDASLRERVELVACHSTRYFSHPEEVLFGAYFNAGDCSGYLHSALAVFQVLGVLFSLPTIVLVLGILRRSSKAPGFSLRLFLLVMPSLVLCVTARFGFGFFLPSLVLLLRAQETHIRASRTAAPTLHPSIFRSR